MSTFLAVNDEILIGEINKGVQRVIYIAPGISKIVATAFCTVLSKLDQLNVTVILDPGDEVCRIGYGDIEGLKILHDFSNTKHFALRSQPGIRTGNSECGACADCACLGNVLDTVDTRCEIKVFPIVNRYIVGVGDASKECR